MATQVVAAVPKCHQMEYSTGPAMTAGYTLRAMLDTAHVQAPRPMEGYDRAQTRTRSRTCRRLVFQAAHISDMEVSSRRCHHWQLQQPWVAQCGGCIRVSKCSELYSHTMRRICRFRVAMLATDQNSCPPEMRMLFRGRTTYCFVVVNIHTRGRIE